MSDKKSSSGTIKTFARVMFVLGVILTVLFTIGIIICGVAMARQQGQSLYTVLGIIGAAIFCVITILLLIVEKAFLLSYAEIAEDVRDVRNIISRRDNTAQ
ncbi:MAG: hypothetical protein ILP16_09940 [Spirochaetales bacterium]|nr:hypothetical protein [Spirochaetales bacterium]